MNDFYLINGVVFNINQVVDIYMDDDGSVFIYAQNKHIIYKSKSADALDFYDYVTRSPFSLKRSGNWDRK